MKPSHTPRQRQFLAWIKWFTVALTEFHIETRFRLLAAKGDASPAFLFA